MGYGAGQASETLAQSTKRTENRGFAETNWRSGGDSNSQSLCNGTTGRRVWPAGRRGAQRRRATQAMTRLARFSAATMHITHAQNAEGPRGGGPGRLRGLARPISPRPAPMGSDTLSARPR
jgi:hypothetical protein